MLMVIFGAGASFDSSAIRPLGDPRGNRPPLANSLFDDRAEFRGARNDFPELHPLIPNLLPHGGRSIEQVFQRYSDQAPTDPMRKQQLVAARYYIRSIFHSTITPWYGEAGNFSNYETLLDQIRHHRKPSSLPVCLVSFNYDTLLERGLTKLFGMPFDTLDEYISNQHYKLFKLHGSQHWGRRLAQVPMGVFQGNRDPWGRPREVIRCIEKITVSGDFEVADSVANEFSGPPLFPAIAIPLANKTDSTFECPARHLAQLTELLPRVTHVLTIGWRGEEQHFLNVLRGVGASSAVAVSNSVQGAERTLGILRAACNVAPVGAWAGFSAIVRDESLDEFIASAV